MKLKVVLTASAIYLGVLGAGFMLAPRQTGIAVVLENFVDYVEGVVFQFVP